MLSVLTTQHDTSHLVTLRARNTTQEWWSNVSDPVRVSVLLHPSAGGSSAVPDVSRRNSAAVDD